MAIAVILLLYFPRIHFCIFLFIYFYIKCYNFLKGIFGKRMRKGKEESADFFYGIHNSIPIITGGLFLFECEYNHYAKTPQRQELYVYRL